MHYRFKDDKEHSYNELLNKVILHENIEEVGEKVLLKKEENIAVVQSDSSISASEPKFTKNLMRPF